MNVECKSLNNKLARVRAAKKSGQLNGYLAGAVVKGATSSQTANSWGPMMRV